MSASREKKMRQNMTKTETVAAAKKNGKAWKTILAVVIVVAILGATVFFTLLNNGSLNASLTALTIDNHKVSPGMLNYFYVEAREELATNMGDLWSMMVSDDVPLSQQSYYTDEFETWGDYILNIAMNKATQMYKLCDRAEATGFELSEESLAEIQDEIDVLESICYLYGYTSVDGYISSTYGTGSNLDNYSEYMRIRKIASEFSAAKIDELQYTEEEIDAYYSENKEAYEEISYQIFDITVDMMENEATAAADCEEAAKEMVASIEDIESFNELCKEYVEEERHKYYDNGAITLMRDQLISEVAEECADWLFAEERQPGDTTYIAYESEEESGYHVLHYIEKTDLNYNVVNFHQVLIETTSDKEEILAVAYEEAMDIYNEYINADEANQTESGFMSLVSQYSSSAEEVSSFNGTHTNVGRGAVDNEYDQWLFAEERQPGDVAVVKSEQGYHVIYFSGKGDTYYNYNITEALRSEDYNEWMSGVLGNTNIKITEYAMKMVNRY